MERGNKRGERRSVTREGWHDVKGAALKERGSMTREAAPSEKRCTVLLHNNCTMIFYFITTNKIALATMMS